MNYEIKILVSSSSTSSSRSYLSSIFSLLPLFLLYYFLSSPSSLYFFPLSLSLTPLYFFNNLRPTLSISSSNHPWPPTVARPTLPQVHHRQPLPIGLLPSHISSGANPSYKTPTDHSTLAHPPSSNHRHRPLRPFPISPDEVITSPLSSYREEHSIPSPQALVPLLRATKPTAHSFSSFVPSSRCHLPFISSDDDTTKPFSRHCHAQPHLHHRELFNSTLSVRPATIFSVPSHPQSFPISGFHESTPTGAPSSPSLDLRGPINQPSLPPSAPLLPCHH